MSKTPASITAKEWGKAIAEDRVDEVEGYCALCGKKVNGLMWCFGCEAFICEECDETKVCGYDHIPKDHKEEK